MLALGLWNLEVRRWCGQCHIDIATEYFKEKDKHIRSKFLYLKRIVLGVSVSAQLLG